MIAEDLKITLPSDTEIAMTREFDAPRRLVWKAMNDPALIPRWWGPRKYETVVEYMDFRVGGKWRFFNVSADGERFGFSGEYLEIIEPEKVVQTFGFDGAPGETARSTVRLIERDGRTLVTETSVFSSRAARDAMIASGMESGARETYERLAELIATLK